MKKIDLFPLWSTLLCYAVVYGVSWLGFGVAIELRAVPIDLLLQLVLGWLLYGLSRHRWAFAAVQLIFMMLLYVALPR
ncbi:MAG: hypothetical protein FD130_2410 [Halothiobacillaceae bacterium]|nr:MAG: hypothetical protein FD130_2410 [Halothiobacillaceae bacterium]